MNKIVIRISILFFIGLFLQACGEQAPERACNFVQNSAEQRVSWSTGSLPVKIYIHNSVPSQYHSDLTAAANHWNERANKPLIQIVAFNAGGSNAPKKDGFNVVTWLDTWDTGNMSEQARTTINWSKSSIYEADIKVNAQSFVYATANGNLNAGAVVDFTSLMIHEFGHVLGLTHNDDVDSVMRPKLAFGQRRGYTIDEHDHAESDIRAADVNSLSCEYSVKSL